MPEGNGSIEYGRFLERLGNVEERMDRVESRQDGFLNQAGTIFRQIGDKERLQLFDLRLSIFQRCVNLTFVALVVILYVTKHPF